MAFFNKFNKDKEEKKSNNYSSITLDFTEAEEKEEPQIIEKKTMDFSHLIVVGKADTTKQETTQIINLDLIDQVEEQAVVESTMQTSSQDLAKTTTEIIELPTEEFSQTNNTITVETTEHILEQDTASEMTHEESLTKASLIETESIAETAPPITQELEKYQENEQTMEEHPPKETGIKHLISALFFDEDISEVYTKRLKNIFLGSTAIILFLASIGGGLILFYRVSIPNFINKTIVEAQQWADENAMKLNITQEYNLHYEEKIIFEQGKDSYKYIGESPVIIPLKVSLGADPDEKIILPNFTEMTKSAIETWKKENVATNIKIVEEMNETIATGDFIRIEFPTTSITTQNYRRKDSAIIYISNGNNEVIEEIEMPDFYQQSKAKVDSWAAENNMTITYIKEYSTSVNQNTILNQNIAAGEKINKTTEIIITISQGLVFIVPNYSQYTQSSAAYVDSRFTTNIINTYHDGVAAGGFISQSIASGTYLYEDDARDITIYFSLGKPYIENLAGTNESQIATYFNNINTKGANLTYTINHIVGTAEQAGTVSHMNMHTGLFNINSHFEIYVYYYEEPETTVVVEE